jgi:outer membrane protein W
MNKLLPAFATAACLAAASTASAQFSEGDFEFRLDGQAQTDVELDGTDLNFTGSIGYLFTDQLEGGIRQGLGYTDINASTTVGSTAAFVNYHFGQPDAKLQPFIGASLGYNYGDGISDTFFAGPEGGVKYFVSGEWFVFGQIEYQFFFEDGESADDAIDDGTFLFRLGFGVVLGS